MAAVVLDTHLAQVCTNREIKISKKHPIITDLNDSLKGADVIDVAQWRFIQLLAGIRNSCDHNKAVEPARENVGELLSGVKKIMKMLF